MMKRGLILALGVLLIAWALARTDVRAQQSWVGMISDATCGADHGGGEVDPRECTQKCIKNGDKYVLAINNPVSVIPIANQDFGALPERAGDIVRVTGEMKNGSIVISKIEPSR